MRNSKCDICPVHGRQEFVSYRQRDSYSCRRCRNERVYEFRRNCKRRLVNLFGGKCEVCNYDKCIRALDFHHIDPTTKCFEISRWQQFMSFPLLLEEAKKCAMICANCHREVEEGLICEIPKDRGAIVAAIEQEKLKCIAQKQKKVKKKHCNKVNKARKSKRPSYAELENLLWKIPTVKIAEKFCVSDKAVEKWAKFYKLSKPPRGYWTKRPVG